MPHGRHIYATASDMANATMCTYPKSEHSLPHWKCVLRCCNDCPCIRNIDTRTVSTALQYTFPVWKCMLRLRICAHCSICHIWCFGINMTSMWHHCIFICCIYVMCFLTRSSALRILALILEFFQIPITPGYQWWMYTFSINATFTTTHNLVTCGHLF